MEKTCISTVANTSENRNYIESVFNIKGVLDFLEERFGEAFQFTQMNDEEWSMFFDDYEDKADGLVFLTKISEHFTGMNVVHVTQGEKRIQESISNSVYFYEEFGVAVAGIYNFTSVGSRKVDYIFFRKDEDYLRYNEEANRRYKSLDDKEIIVYTDTSNGVKVERKTVETMIDRSQVVLEKKVKEDIYESIDQFFQENRDFYKKYHIPHRRGILLYGKPGNGKTTLIKSLVGSIDSPVLYWQVNEFTNSQSIQHVFDAAAELAPAVLVIEDLDSLPALARSTFLNTLDGATTKEGIFLIGTTNYPERIDEALINRAGRFDRTYEIQLPNEQLRFDYLKMRGISDFLPSDEEIKEITRKTDGFSFVQLSEVFHKIAYDGHHDKPIDANGIIAALKENNLRTNTKNWNAAAKAAVGFSN